MKKLLALILCVMMFVAIIPTAAFAEVATPTDWNPLWKLGGNGGGWFSTQVNKNAIEDLNDAIDDMYYAFAADQTVFTTAKGMHDFADGLVKGLFADVDDYDSWTAGTIDHDDLVKNSRSFVKAIFGAGIQKYMNDRAGRYTDAFGYIDDYEAYLNTYVAAVNNVMSSSKAQKGIEAFAYGLFAMGLQDKLHDKFDDLRDEIIDWNDYGSTKWDEFGFQPVSTEGLGLDGLFYNSNVFVPESGLTFLESITMDDILTGEAGETIREYTANLYD